MKSTSETGHAKNVANFEALISFCKGYGAMYNPGKSALSIAALETLYQQALAALDDVHTNLVAFNNAVNKRAEAFKPLRSHATRIINALDSTDASPETIKDARTIVRKLNGKRAGTKNGDTPPAEGETPGNDRSISVSQMSFDNLVEHFSRLIKILASDSNYNPNESELTLSGNQAKLAELKNANTNVIDSYTNWDNSRIRRDSTLYNILTGLVPIAFDVKKYVKSLYGANSTQYKQVSSLQFKTQKS